MELLSELEKEMEEKFDRVGIHCLYQLIYKGRIHYVRQHRGNVNKGRCTTYIEPVRIWARTDHRYPLYDIRSY
jgi:hypothetical protein